MADYLNSKLNSPYLPDLQPLPNFALQDLQNPNPPMALSSTAPTQNQAGTAGTLALLSQLGALKGKSQGGSSGGSKGGKGSGDRTSHGKGTGAKGLPNKMSNSPGQNRRIAKTIIQRKYPSSWAHGKQWSALNRVVGMESGWNAKADNPKSTAYGIAQRLMSDHPIQGAGDDYMHSPIDQVQWLLRYIKGRYGSPVGALHHEQTHNWY